MDRALTVCAFKNYLLTLNIQKKLLSWSSREDKPGTRVAATKTAHPPPHPPPPPPPLLIVAQRLWNLTITLSYYWFLAKAEKRWRNNEKLLSSLRDRVMAAKDKFILQLNLVGSSSSQTFFIIVFMKRDFVESVL